MPGLAQQVHGPEEARASLQRLLAHQRRKRQRLRSSHSAAHVAAFPREWALARAPKADQQNSAGAKMHHGVPPVLCAAPSCAFVRWIIILNTLSLMALLAFSTFDGAD